MFDWILLAVGVIGFGLAGYWDLKTTEFPDWLPYLIIISALLVRGLEAFMGLDVWIFLESVMWGCGFLALGYGMYFLKQWGDGDAWLLGALGFLFPNSSLLVRAMPATFPFAMLFNFFIISFFYLIVYSMAVGIRNRKVLRKFSSEFPGKLRDIVAVFIAFAVLCIALMYYITFAFGVPLQLRLLIFPPFLLAVLVFVYYGKFIEANIFRKNIPASKLRTGDVPVDEKWRVLTAKEVERIKKRGGKVLIKEGARMAPVFLITLLVTVFYGFLLM